MTRTVNLTLAAALVAAILAALLLGSVSLSPLRVLSALGLHGDPGDALVVWQIRLPRALAAAMVGAALGMSGAALELVLV